MITELIEKLEAAGSWNEVIREFTEFIKKLGPGNVSAECLKELETAIAGILVEDVTVGNGFYLASFHQWGIHRPLTPLAPINCVRTNLIDQDKKRAALMADFMGLQEFLIIQVAEGKLNTFWI